MELIGFKTTNSVKVKIYELDKIGEIIDVIILNSDELIDFESITFDLEDKTTIIKSAREIAVKNAIEKGINFIGGLDLQYIKIKDNVNLPPKYDVYLKKFYKND